MANELKNHGGFVGELHTYDQKVGSTSIGVAEWDYLTDSLVDEIKQLIEKFNEEHKDVGFEAQFT